MTIHWESAKPDRRDEVRITVDGVLCFDVFSPVSNPSDVLCYTEMSGQAVTLSKNDRTTVDDYYITVCEVEVWVCLPGFFGNECQHACAKHVCENNQVCSPLDGTCPEDPTCACRNYGSCMFYSSPSNKRNVAVGKRAKMSSEYHSLRYDETSGPGCLAVNGKTDTNFRPLNKFSDSPNCIHTGDDDREPFWEVDLGERYRINSITIYWRDARLHQRSYGVEVTVDGQLCHTFRSPVSNPSSITCVTQLAGQTVRLSKNDHKIFLDYFITVCEVEVWVCLPGFFGSECQHVCPKPVCKNNQTCSPFDGTCPKAAGAFSLAGLRCVNGALRSVSLTFHLIGFEGDLNKHSTNNTKDC